MSQVLSQQEIDSLLVAMDNGEIDEQQLEEVTQPKVKEYDFRRPVRLSKEYLSTVTMVCEDFAKILVNQLSTQLRRPVELKLASIEQVSFDEFVHSVPRFTLMGLFESHPLDGVQIVEINPQASLQMVELLCGYNLSEEQTEISGRDHFTEIERSILEEVLDLCVQSFESSWRDIVQLESKMESLETNPQLLQNMSPNEPVVLATFSMTIGGNHSFMNLCIPYIFFEKILDKLSFTNWFHAGKKVEEKDNSQLKGLLNPVPLNMEVLLGETEMTVEDFLEMDTGDIIQMNHLTTQPLNLLIEGQPYYKVKPGMKKNKLAVEVLQVIEGETNE